MSFDPNAYGALATIGLATFGVQTMTTTYVRSAQRTMSDAVDSAINDYPDLTQLSRRAGSQSLQSGLITVGVVVLQLAVFGTWAWTTREAPTSEPYWWIGWCAVSTMAIVAALVSAFYTVKTKSLKNRCHDYQGRRYNR
jgi:hypothetical protein